MYLKKMYLVKYFEDFTQNLTEYPSIFVSFGGKFFYYLTNDRFPRTAVFI